MKQICFFVIFLCQTNWDLFLAAPPNRPRGLDLVFVMDKSGSIGSANFKLEKKFIANLIEYFDIFPTKTRVAVVTYSTLVKEEFDFNKHINKDCLRKGIQDITCVFILK